MEVIIIACTNPLKGFPVGLTKNGKPAYKIVPFCTDHLEERNGSWFPCDTPFRSPQSSRYLSDYVVIPCGQCLECRMQYARNWADRCLLELQYHDSSYFVTLTYDDDHLDTILTSDGALSLCKRDIQLFHKRLRSALVERDGSDAKIRFFCCGEYGDDTKRPHYHDIIFGLRLDDLVYYKRNNDTGCRYYTSAFLSRLWSYGYVIVGEVTWESCAYTARYVTKKAKGLTKDIYSKLGIEPEFVLMSRRPGIGRQYYDNHPNLYDFNSISIATKSGGISIRPPRYFDKLLEVDNPDLYANIKTRRIECGDVVTSSKLLQTDLSEFDMLGVAEDAANSRLKIFKRGAI